jgi:hypothetical protein
MRRPDLPDSSASPGEPADGHPDAGQRVERDWQALTERLLRLPDAHPSSPHRGDRTGPGEPEEIRPADGQCDAAEPGSEQARSGAAEPDQDGELIEPQDGPGPGPDDAADPGRGSGGPGGAGWAGGRGAAGDSAGAGRDPYRPWFAGGVGSEPWFTGPDGLAARPDGPTGPAG